MTPDVIFSPDRRYRYTLWRGTDVLSPSYPKIAMFIGLNPSTADELRDDPTVRRCIGFAERWGCNKMVMTNLFAFRATNPTDMVGELNPCGDDNDHWLMECASQSNIIVAAWGTHGKFLGRDEEVVKLLGPERLLCLSTNKDGTPRHPLYVPYHTELFNFVLL